MVRAWMMDKSSDDPRLPHQTDPLQSVSLSSLSGLGVLYWHVPVTGPDVQYSSPLLQHIRTQRGYSRHDFVEPAKMPNFEEKLKIFFEEHLHIDEEIRYVLEGSGYFDVRNDSDEWIRILVEAGDLIVLPAGIYHRFTLDTNNHAKVMRLFVDEPKWTPYNRALPDTDKLEARSRYLNNRNKWTEESKSSVNGVSVVVKHIAQAKANYPHLRQVNGMLYLSGVSSRQLDNSYRGVTVHDDGTVTRDIAEQTHGVIQNLKAVLNSVGADLSHLVDVTCFLTDMKNYAEFNRVYNSYFDVDNGPTRTTVGVRELPGPNILLEIKAVAVAPNCKL